MGHISTVEVRYAETDQMGIAHHSNYAVWFEVARTDFIKAAGISYTDVEKGGIITPLSQDLQSVVTEFYRCLFL